MEQTYSIRETAVRIQRTRQAVYDFAKRHPSAVVRGAKPLRLHSHRVDEYARALFLVSGREGRAS